MKSLLPILQRLEDAKRVLIAGCGGGFDIYAGIPIAMECLTRGQEIILANLSFADLASSGTEKLAPTLWRVNQSSNKLGYFPEQWLSEWLSLRGLHMPVYAFAKSGVVQLKQAYEAILANHQIDRIILVDGGTDSVLFGNEPGLGTVVEDAVSLVAAEAVAGDKVTLASVGFGIDHFHGVSHYSFLENVAELIRSGGYLGALGPASGSMGVQAFLDLVDYANARQPQSRSVVCNSLASAFRGEFGDYHATPRTAGSELFINPLMTQYWLFDAGRVVHAMAYADALRGTDSFAAAEAAITRYRDGLPLRPRRPLPL